MKTNIYGKGRVARPPTERSAAVAPKDGVGGFKSLNHTEARRDRLRTNGSTRVPHTPTAYR